MIDLIAVVCLLSRTEFCNIRDSLISRWCGDKGFVRAWGAECTKISIKFP